MGRTETLFTSSSAAVMNVSLFSFPNPVDEVSARLVAGGVVVIAGLYLITQWSWLLFLLVWGFVSRVLTGPKLSPLGFLVTRIIRPKLNLSERLTAGPPKRFAQGIGAVFSISAMVSYFCGVTSVSLLLVASLTIFAFLEAAVGFCAGCWVFRQLVRAGLVTKSTCESCNEIWAQART
tara:strand:+ start:25 stop:558 length:534 start_codon:yes stop_codon:yes gene_type:complete